jgi:hypothetical protein
MDLGWRSGAQGTVWSGGLIRRAEWTLQTLERLGVVVPSRSRLPNARDLLVRAETEPTILNSEDPSFLERVADAHRTVWDFFVITNAAVERRFRVNTPFRLDVIGTALHGADVAREDRNPLGRNTQFELYVAAVLCLGRAEVNPGEPDLRLLYWGKDTGVAAKRMGSAQPRSIAKRVLEGARQIARSGTDGFVAVNIDILFIGVELGDEIPQRWEQLNRQTAVAVDAIMRRLGPRRDVKGVLLFGHAAQWDLSASPPAYAASYPLSYHLIADGLQDEERGREFFSGLTARIDNSMRGLL